MEAKSMSSFAAGLLVAAGVCGAVYYFDTNEVKSTQALENLSEEEMRNKLTAEGYVIYNEDEWKDKLSSEELELNEKLNMVEAEWQKKLDELTAEKSGEKAPSNEQVAYRTIVNVASGMTSIDVGRALVNAKIVDNAMTFVKEVEKRGLANDLQPGSYELDSSMSMDEAIAIIFK